MIHIAICDDDEEQVATIRAMTEAYLSKHQSIHADVATFFSAAGIQKLLDEREIPDVLLLDICMPHISGIQLAKEIRRRNCDTKIIFLTASSDYAVAAFSVEASHYLVKPFTKEQFEKALDRALAAVKKSPGITVTGEAGAISVIPADDIFYIESIGYKRYVYTQAQTLIEVRRTLTQFMDELNRLSPGQFLIPYRGYIINLNSVRTLTPSSIEMQNGTHIPIKTGDYRSLRDTLFNWSFLVSDNNGKGDF